MNFVPPKGFPQDLFQEFGKCASELFPAPLSDQALSDPLQRRYQFMQAWQAVRFRYRACCEANEEFKSLFLNASDLWREWNMDEEHSYKMERCLYTFFMNGLSVFESFGFCLYFVGNAINANAFDVKNPKVITLRATSEAFASAFPKAAISERLARLRKDSEFCELDSIRNILAHRISGMRSVRGQSVLELNGTITGSVEDVYHLHGASELKYDEQLIERNFNGITAALTAMTTDGLEFVRATKKPRTASVSVP